jgi:CheY-like chemotaxis protein
VTLPPEPAAASGMSLPFEDFQNLMPYRVHDILLVSSLYDSFTLQEDGRLNELILGEFLKLSLQHTPGLTHVSSGVEALARASSERRFNLILTTIHPGDMDASDLAREVKRRGLDIPVVVLAYDNNERKEFIARRNLSDLERIFLWQGDPRILVAIVNLVEDARNVAHDTAAVGVPVILLVEDNVRYYSAFLPTIYTELIQQSGRVISEGVNLSHKLVRMRARPKILLASTFEDAWQLFTRYRAFMLGLISDVEFPRDGALVRGAGFELARQVRAALPDLPILLQSSRVEFASGATEVGAAFVRKYSETLLGDLRRFMVEHFAFGDFVFRRPDGREVARAGDLKTLEERLHTVPAECIGFHGERNHFSHWFTARTEFALARKLRPRKVSEFPTLEALRHDLIAAIAEYRNEQNDALVADFDRHSFDPHGAFFARIGGGSLGGKARGLAFVRHLLHAFGLARGVPGVHIGVPASVVLATDCFDQFLVDGGLLGLALESRDDDEILRRFLATPLPDRVRADLAAFLEFARWPLAVRSSSILEDSQYRPFTGVYETFMLANDHPDFGVRMQQLEHAIKRVYASTFVARARDYLDATPYRLEEEKMAVILQRVVGGRHGDRYYPDFSGVARSWNYYPAPPARAEDGIATVALGLGRAVVEGGSCLSFSPRHPQALLQFSTVEDILRNSQREFWGLELGPREGAPDSEAALRETCFGLEVAEADGTLSALGSTWSEENQAIYDGLSRRGVRLVTFAPILKQGVFPLAPALDRLLGLAARGLSRAAEIEFAVRLSPDRTEPHELGFLQMRPLVPATEVADVEVDEPRLDQLLCRSPQVLGHGRVDTIRDVVVADFHRFERGRSAEAAAAIAQFNAELTARGRPYLLIGVGRWGSQDPWLGIPVTWEQISGARVIVEAGFADLPVTPSQGSHFFQNLTSFQVGYFTVNPDVREGFVDWEWLEAQPAEGARDLVRHLRFEAAISVRMNGRNHRGVIYRPGCAPD